MARKLIAHHLVPSRNLLLLGGNPEGVPVTDQMLRRYRVVRIGKEGERTHLYDPRLLIYDRPAQQAGAVLLQTGGPLCKSGFVKHSKTKEKIIPKLYLSEAKIVTCYRCVRLANENQKREQKNEKGR